jgi:hypothetical protein
MQFLNFKQWICESADFPEPEDLSAFLSHAATVCIRTHQEMFKMAQTQKQNDLVGEISSLGELLQHIHQSLEDKIPNEPLDTDKFQGKPSPTLNKPQYPIKYPTLRSIIPILRTIGGNPAIDKPTSQALSDKIQSLLRAWNSALQQS